MVSSCWQGKAGWSSCWEFPCYIDIAEEEGYECTCAPGARGRAAEAGAPCKEQEEEEEEELNTAAFAVHNNSWRPFGPLE